MIIRAMRLNATTLDQLGTRSAYARN